MDARIDAGLRALGMSGRAHDGPLPVELRLTHEAVEVDIGGYVEKFSLAVGQDREESCDLALDLVAAALFGEIRILRQVGRGASRSHRAELRVGERWAALGQQGRLGVLAGLGAAATMLQNPASRPPGFEDFAPSGLPFAPWAGAGGFYGHDADAPKSVEVDGVLDLHNHSPKDLKPLVLEYIEQCRGLDITELRIIHGKGKGVLRRTVHSILDKHPEVEGYRLGGHGGGGWGATIVDLRSGGEET